MCLRSVTYSFARYLLNNYCVPGLVLYVGEIAKSLPSWGWHCQEVKSARMNTGRVGGAKKDGGRGNQSDGGRGQWWGWLGDRDMKVGGDQSDGGGLGSCFHQVTRERLSEQRPEWSGD